MDHQYDDKPNSCLWRARFSNTVYHHPDPSILPTIRKDDLKQWHSVFNSKWAAANRHNTSKTCHSTAMSTSKLSPDGNLTSGVQEGSHTVTSEIQPAPTHKSMSSMFKDVKKTARRLFVALHSGETTEKSSSRPKKESSWPTKYIDRELCRVDDLDKSSEVH